MRTHIRTLLEGTALVLLGVLLFRFPEASAAAAREGVTLCLDLIVPSLFPFFVLSSLLIATGLAGACARPLEKLMRPLFGVGGAGAAALFREQGINVPRVTELGEKLAAAGVYGGPLPLTLDGGEKMAREVMADAYV